jgi:hypothetical protein
LAGAPLNLVDKIVDILVEENSIGRLNLGKMKSSRACMKELCKLFPGVPKAKMVTITHERTAEEVCLKIPNPTVSFPVFPFLVLLQDLLNDRMFGELDKLVVDPNDRWNPYKQYYAHDVIDEMQDGDWFQDLLTHMPLEKDDFVFGLQGYVDKTAATGNMHQRTSIKPFVFTLTNLGDSTRNNPKNWRIMSILPRLDHNRMKKSPYGAPIRNYHKALLETFKELIHLQKHPPYVRLRLRTKKSYQCST